MDFEEWNGFNKKGEWTEEIAVRDFIQANYKPYTGDESFLTGATDRTKKLWNKVLDLYEKERADVYCSFFVSTTIVPIFTSGPNTVDISVFVKCVPNANTITIKPTPITYTIILFLL